MFFSYLILSVKLWLFAELVNWFWYLRMYTNIICPKFMKYKEIDTMNIIERIDKLTKDEIEYIIKGCIIYDKILHMNVEPSEIELNNLSGSEIENLIAYSLFGLENQLNEFGTKRSLISKTLEKIESKLGYRFKYDVSNTNNTNKDRYLYRKWGSNFIKFSFRPLILQFPLRIIICGIHLLFTLWLGFKWEKINGVGFLSKNPDPNKKNLIFIHGLGFGYIPYFRTLMKLNSSYNLVIVVLPNISSYNYYDDMNYEYFPSPTLISDGIYRFIESKNIDNSIILAHSFGTYITQILRKNKKSTIFEKIIMVDPIIFWIGCFKMSLHVENPFIKKYPLTTYLIDNIISFMIYQCLYLKYVCFRVMFGPDFWVYDVDEISNNNITLILEKEDYVIPAELLYLKVRNKIKTYYFDSEGMTHGTILMDDKYTQKLIEIINE